MAVRWGDLDERHIEREYAVAEERRHFTQEDGNVVGSSHIDCLPHVGSYEERIGVEGIRIFFCRVGRFAFGMKVHHVDAVQRGGSSSEGADEFLRCGGRGVDEYAVATLDEGDGPIRRYNVHGGEGEIKI